MNSFDKFDHDYCNKVRDAVWQAIEAASFDPVSGLSIMRNGEAYSALLNVMAGILAQSKAPAHAIDGFAAHLAEKLVERVGWARAALRDGSVVGRNDMN